MARAQTPDADLLTEAEDQGYVILTEDKDFGELVFRDRRNSHGVVLLRRRRAIHDDLRAADEAVLSLVGEGHAGVAQQMFQTDGS